MSTAPSTTPDPTDFEQVIADSEFDFIDFGAGIGGSLRHYEIATGAKGLGVELRPHKVAEAQALGRQVVQGSIFEFPDRPMARFVTIDNVLEHLPTLDEVELALTMARNIASEFIYIRHPAFDDEPYLESLGVRTYWCNWRAHPSHIRLADFAEIASRVGLGTMEVHPVGVIRDSDHPSVLPLSAPIDQHDYDEALHGPKPHVSFDRDVYSAYDIIFHLGPTPTLKLTYVGDPLAGMARPRMTLLSVPTAPTEPASDVTWALRTLAKEGRNSARRVVRRGARAARGVVRRLRAA